MSIRKSKKEVLNKIRLRTRENPNLSLGEIASELWIELKKEIGDVSQYTPNQPEYKRFYHFARAMHLLSVSKSSKVLAIDYLNIRKRK